MEKISNYDQFRIVDQNSYIYSFISKKLENKAEEITEKFNTFIQTANTIKTSAQISFYSVVTLNYLESLFKILQEEINSNTFRISISFIRTPISTSSPGLVFKFV